MIEAKTILKAALEEIAKYAKRCANEDGDQSDAFTKIARLAKNALNRAKLS